jgi:hypothetical protein
MSPPAAPCGIAAAAATRSLRTGHRSCSPICRFATAGSRSHVPAGGGTATSTSQSGAAKLAELNVKRLDVHIAGSGDIEAAPKEELNVDIAGSGNVRLLSNPQQVTTSIHGSGRLIRAASQ